MICVTVCNLKLSRMFSAFGFFYHCESIQIQSYMEKVESVKLVFVLIFAGKTQMKLTWCRRRRPTWSVRRWSSLSMRRDLHGTRIPPKTRKKRRKSNTGPGVRGKKRNCSFECYCTFEKGFVGVQMEGGGGPKQARLHWMRLDVSLIGFYFYSDMNDL